ncbi:leucine-rich repeat domain-containing protein [Marinoscillum pacificum]|uniref:leucine-rich repeat domain-containing protein n=1 Tax=Marinoscillum pacificum TaxID=392723 RepID=UPI002157F786|nr:hypothetical protein [Marinoscillum pacificum]
MRIAILIFILFFQSSLFGQGDRRFTSLEEASQQPGEVKWLDLDCEDIPLLPEKADQLINLESLYLTDCKLQQLPDGLGELESLGLLNVQDNKLKTLPTDIANLEQLSVLNLRNNDFEELPEWLSELSNLREIDLSGNEPLDID